jgi:hypothetical protein
MLALTLARDGSIERILVPRTSKHTVDAGDETGGDSRTPHHARDRPLREAQIPAHFNEPSIANDERHLSQQVLRRYRGIGIRQGVATGKDGRISGVLGSHYPVREELVRAPEQHDISFGHGTGGGGHDQERISRPDDRQHASAGGAQTQSAGGSQHLRCQITLQCARRVRLGVSRSHDLLLVEQFTVVVLTFPQESAVVTKTCS